MAIRAGEAACASAWRTYLLLHKEVNEDDDRLTTLHRYITHLCEDGECNPDALRKAGLLYLRKLDELGEERDERLARYRALERNYALRRTWAFQAPEVGPMRDSNDAHETP